MHCVDVTSEWGGEYPDGFDLDPHGDPWACQPGCAEYNQDTCCPPNFCTCGAGETMGWRIGWNKFSGSPVKFRFLRDSNDEFVSECFSISSGPGSGILLESQQDQIERWHAETECPDCETGCSPSET